MGGDLLYNIKEQVCIPFIGPEAHIPWIPQNKAIAVEWAEQYGYPLEHYYKLSKVANFWQ